MSRCVPSKGILRLINHKKAFLTTETRLKKQTTRMALQKKGAPEGPRG